MRWLRPILAADLNQARASIPQLIGVLRELTQTRGFAGFGGYCLWIWRGTSRGKARCFDNDSVARGQHAGSTPRIRHFSEVFEVVGVRSAKESRRTEMTTVLLGKELALDADGHLANRSDWSPELAAELAARRRYPHS